MKNKAISKTNTGFTLIELLVVIVIVGILASLTTYSVTSARKKAYDAQKKSDMHELQGALEQYRTTNRNYPVMLGWQNTLINGSLLRSIVIAPGLVGDYTYNATGSLPQDYILTIQLENKKDSGIKVEADGVYTLRSRQ